MNATIVDLRYRMREVLKALERREDVSILYHGKVKGVIKAGNRRGVFCAAKHPFFNMRRSGRSVEEEMDAVRGGRDLDL